jgi:hypothetical protein
LYFDNMKNLNNEPMKLLKPGTETEAGIAGPRRVGKWVQPGGSGQEVGKRTGFAQVAPASTRLGPDNSTQVVDFPRICSVRLFPGSREMGSHGWNRIKHRLGKETEQMERRFAAKEHKERWEIPQIKREWAADAFAFWWRFSVQLNALKCA